MGTSNFWSMRNFDIHCLVIEYDEEWYAETYPELDERARMEIWEQDSESLYNEIWESIENDIGKTGWMFHTVEMRSGYYEGIQIHVKEPEYRYLDTDLRWMYEESTGRRCKLNRRELHQRYWKEVNLIRRWLEDMRVKHGLTVLRVFARFDNGETWHSNVYNDEEVES